jgi:hypothetical protein
MKKIFFALLIILFVFACRTDVTQKKMPAGYRPANATAQGVR